MAKYGAPFFRRTASIAGAVRLTARPATAARAVVASLVFAAPTMYLGQNWALRYEGVKTDAQLYLGEGILR